MEEKKLEDYENIVEIINKPEPLPRRVPDYMRKAGGIWYWTGALTMFAFLYEVVTGIILLFYYQPSNAYTSTETFLHSVPYGEIILTTHLYGAYIMIALVYIHLLRNIFVGAYKRPRRDQFLSGILLLLLTLGVGYFGYSLSGDVLSADATDVGRGIAQGFPYIGNYLMEIIFGNGTQTSLFHRLLAWHILLAGLIAVLIAAHFFLAEARTIMPKRSESNYRVPAIDKEKPDYKPWYPYNMLYMVELGFFSVALIFILPSLAALVPGVPMLFSPFPQLPPDNPAAAALPAYPPWFLLFMYKELDFTFAQSMGPFWATVLFAGLPLAYLILLPYIDTSISLKISERPIFNGLAIVGILYLIGLSVLGALTPGQPIPTLDAAAIFIVPLIIVLPLSYYIAKLYRTGKINNVHIGVIGTVPVIGFFAFELGSLLPGYFRGYGGIYLEASIFMATVLVLIFLVLMKVEGYFKSTTPKKPMSKRSYILVSAILGFFTLFLATIVSTMNPTSITDEAFYAMGIGFIFIALGTITKIYRKTAYNE
ncbi:cytochrome b [Thermoplasma volcanium GSS1]|uniref:Cytochrome b n=1 Tax=Thermoplasma volcanium (strain ATCC 51530 / DSM 4299 / JCM 9571 / NBRC 15438 / GSS1) TaxID=273116 RepID=Q97BT4_THEVO|nr:cytochrome bc complex cytochrome b subunit [Thermoplasma volcanium]BAB59513.1 cytochrome b [Thermoplasma volcanium GSS1]